MELDHVSNTNRKIDLNVLNPIWHTCKDIFTRRIQAWDLHIAAFCAVL